MAQGQYKLSEAKPIGQFRLDQASPVDATQPKAEAEHPSQVVEGLKAAWDYLNPVSVVKGTAHAIAHSLDPSKENTFAQMGRANEAVARQGIDAFQKGDYVTAGRHFIDWVLGGLGVGPGIDQAANEFQQGEYGKGAGHSVGLGIVTAAPAQQWTGGVRVPAVMKNPNPAEAAAVDFGLERGIPVDAATATGNRFAKGVGKLADESMLGSLVSERAGTARTAALNRVGNELAGKVSPAAETPETAGAALRADAERYITQQHGEATAAYDRLRQIEEANTRNVARPGTQGFIKVEAPVDISGLKADLAPIYEKLKPASGVTVMGGTKTAAALKALQGLMDAPNVISLADADAALSTLKAIARGADMPELRSLSQGQAALAVQKLTRAVDAAVARLGPEARTALDAGRAATKAKFEAADTLAMFADEPVQAFRNATMAKDAGIERLRALAKIAPDAPEKVGRAFLDDLFTKATSEGGFGHNARLLSDWQNLGPSTKRMLFKDPELISDLDKFFLLQDRLARSPNPSGTALTAWKGGELTAYFVNPVTGATYSLASGALSKLMHSPTFVKALVKGLSVPLGNKTAAAGAVAGILDAAGQDAIPVSGTGPRAISPTGSARPAPAPGR